MGIPAGKDENYDSSINIVFWSWDTWQTILQCFFLAIASSKSGCLSPNRSSGEGFAVMTPPPKDRFSGWDKGSALRIRLCESAPLAPPALADVQPCFSLPVLSAVSMRKMLFNWQVSKLYSLKAQLQPGNTPTQQQLCHCLTSFQPRPVVKVMVHFGCSHHCQGKLGLANPCHYSCGKKILCKRKAVNAQHKVSSSCPEQMRFQGILFACHYIG